MTPVDPAVIRRKLTVITTNLRALEPIATIDPARYRAEIFTRKGTERLLQELIEAALDLNTHFLSQAGRKLPDDYYQSSSSWESTESCQRNSQLRWHRPPV